MNPNFRASSNPGWSIQLEVTDACDDMSSSCSSMHQNPASPPPLPDLTSGLRLFTATLPMWDSAIPRRPQFDKNKEITAARFSYYVPTIIMFSARSSFGAGWLQACRQGLQTRSALSWFQKRGGRVTSAYCFVTQTWPQVKSIIQWKNKSCNSKALTPSWHWNPFLFFLCTIMRRWAARHVQEVKLNKLTALNGDYRRPRCKSSTMGANLVESVQQQQHVFQNDCHVLACYLLVGFQTS